MKKELDNKMKENLLLTKEWCVMLINFMISKAGFHNSLKETLNVVNDAYSNKNLTGLKSIKKDLSEWINVLSKSDISELNMLLQNKFGEDLNTDTTKTIKAIEKIISKGKIINDEEYELVLKRVEEIYENKNQKSKVETLNILLANYLRAQS